MFVPTKRAKKPRKANSDFFILFWLFFLSIRVFEEMEIMKKNLINTEKNPQIFDFERKK